MSKAELEAKRMQQQVAVQLERDRLKAEVAELRAVLECIAKAADDVIQENPEFEGVIDWLGWAKEALEKHKPTTK